MIKKFLDRLLVATFIAIAFWPELTVVIGVTAASTAGALKLHF